MKNRGFTLIELLGVIIILGVIALITVPTVNSSLKEQKVDLCKVQYENILMAAKSYGADHLGELKNGYTFTLENLQNNGYIDENLKNPIGNKTIDKNLIIEVSQEVDDETNRISKTTYGFQGTTIEGLCSND